MSRDGVFGAVKPSARHFSERAAMILRSARLSDGGYARRWTLGRNYARESSAVLRQFRVGETGSLLDRRKIE